MSLGSGTTKESTGAPFCTPLQKAIKFLAFSSIITWMMSPPLLFHRGGNAKAQLREQRRSKHSGFQRLSSHMGRVEAAHEQLPVVA